MLINEIKARREAKGLKLVWFIPDENRDFTAYPKDDVQKQEWLDRAAANGWHLR